MKRIALNIILIMCSLLVYSQDYTQSIKGDGQPKLTLHPEYSGSIYKLSNKPAFITSYTSDLKATPRLHTFSIDITPEIYSNSDLKISKNPYINDFSRYGALQIWKGGYLVGAGSYSTMPALGNIGRASIAISQQLGNLTVTGGISGEKYHIGRDLHNNYAVFGNASYRFNERFTLNVFGSYYAKNNFYSFAAMPYVGYSNYGASLGYSINDKFGVELGAQRYFDPYSRSWKTVPIIAPSFNIGGQKIGFDIGGLVYQILDGLLNNYSESSNMNGMSGSGNSGFSSGSSPMLQKWTDKHR
ncbi:MAG: hypothetical protein PHR45_06050 [Muribaculaceae bacterium]|nr:hypothetical protein [Muribaculaceae bacterium]